MGKSKGAGSKSRTPATPPRLSLSPDSRMRTPLVPWAIGLGLDGENDIQDVPAVRSVRAARRSMGAQPTVSPHPRQSNEPAGAAPWILRLDAPVSQPVSILQQLFLAKHDDEIPLFTSRSGRGAAVAAVARAAFHFGCQGCPPTYERGSPVALPHSGRPTILVMVAPPCMGSGLGFQRFWLRVKGLFLRAGRAEGSSQRSYRRRASPPLKPGGERRKIECV